MTTAPTPATTGTGRRFLYWRCPVCPAFVRWPAWSWFAKPSSPYSRDGAMSSAEMIVEAHEARHGIGAA